MQSMYANTKCLHFPSRSRGNAPLSGGMGGATPDKLGINKEEKPGTNWHDLI